MTDKQLRLWVTGAGRADIAHGQCLPPSGAVACLTYQALRQTPPDAPPPYRARWWAVPACACCRTPRAPPVAPGR